MKTFGNCEKHMNFPLANCPVCESEAVGKIYDDEIAKLDARISAGKEVIRLAKEQLKVLRSRKRELERLKPNQP